VVRGVAGCLLGARREGRSLATARERRYCRGTRATYRDSNHDVFVRSGSTIPTAMRPARHRSNSLYTVSTHLLLWKQSFCKGSSSLIQVTSYCHSLHFQIRYSTMLNKETNLPAN